MIGLVSSSSLAEKMSDISFDASLSTLRFVENMLTLRFFVDVKRMSAVCRLDNVEPPSTLRLVDEKVSKFSVLAAENDI